MSTPSTASAAPQTQSYQDMDAAAFKTALIAIIRTSAAPEEVKQRLRDELSYPYTISIHAGEPPTRGAGGAAALSYALGGAQLSTGAMVMVMAYCPSGKVIHI